MACGLPVVTSRINGASEIITAGVNGAIVEEPSDIAALADALRLFRDPAVRQRAGGAARRVAEGLSVAANVEQTLKIITGCCRSLPR
jgi:UDP-glucose:(heptosyl)LPS alpha-1,3-glucosyltransferase